MLFGAKRERYIPNQDENQLSLPFDVESETEPEKEQLCFILSLVRAKKMTLTLMCGLKKGLT